MPKTKEEIRQERKLKFIATLKERQTRELLEPLRQKIQAFIDGKLATEDMFKAVHHADVMGEKLIKRFRNRPDVVLAEIAMDENKFTTEIGGIGIKARHGDITSLFADAIVDPADPRGVMADGVAAAIKVAGGEEIEKEAMAKGPLAVGKAVATTAGKLPNVYVIHVAVADAPGAPSSPENARAAAAAALFLAEELKIESVAFPALGTGAGGVAPEDAAEAIIEAIKAHKAKSVSDITLMSREEKIVQAFVKILEKLEEQCG
jgi:O-acetyl-ADP-ribose deacetylase (regulator of RNase III)